MAKAEFRLEGEVGEIVLDDPPLNLFDLELSRDLARAAGEARDSAARAILVRAEGDNFSAGAGRAAEAVLTARPYPAETMLEWGVVNRVVAADELREKATSFVRRLAAGPTLAHAATKRMIRLAVDEGVEAADAALSQVGAGVMASEDLQNGARTLLEKGPGHASFEGR